MKPSWVRCQRPVSQSPGLLQHSIGHELSLQIIFTSSQNDESQSIACCLLLLLASAIMINGMDDYSSPTFIQTFTRFSSRHEFPKKVFCNKGSQLIKGTKDISLSYTNLKSRLFKEQNVDFQTFPVDGHIFNGRVERIIKKVNMSLEKIYIRIICLYVAVSQNN